MLSRGQSFFAVGGTNGSNLLRSSGESVSRVPSMPTGAKTRLSPPLRVRARPPSTGSERHRKHPSQLVHQMGQCAGHADKPHLAGLSELQECFERDILPYSPLPALFS